MQVEILQEWAWIKNILNPLTLKDTWTKGMNKNWMIKDNKSLNMWGESSYRRLTLIQ
jgi:hypothetical protein